MQRIASSASTVAQTPFGLMRVESLQEFNDQMIAQAIHDYVHVLHAARADAPTDFRLSVSRGGTKNKCPTNPAT